MLGFRGDDLSGSDDPHPIFSHIHHPKGAPTMQASPNPHDIYPSEIIEWSAMLAEPEGHSERQQRATDILTDDGVMHAAPHVLAVMLADNDRWQEEDRANRLDGFSRFIEEAAALPDQQPPGSYVREPGELPVFSTPGELRRDISTAASVALDLAELIGRIATTMADAMPIEESRRLIDSLDALHSACTAKAHMHSTKSDGVPDVPLPGSVAGSNAWGQWMLSKLDMLAAIHLRGDYPALVRAVQNALLSNEAAAREQHTYEIRGTRSYSVTM